MGAHLISAPWAKRPTMTRWQRTKGAASTFVTPSHRIWGTEDRVGLLGSTKAQNLSIQVAPGHTDDGGCPLCDPWHLRSGRGT